MLPIWSIRTVEACLVHPFHHWSRPRRSGIGHASRLHEPSSLRSMSARLLIRPISDRR